MNKRVVYCIVLLFLATNLKAQLFVNKTNINEMKSVNLLVVSLKEPHGRHSEWNIYNVNLTVKEGGPFTDSSGKREVEIYTLTEILNYVTARGWDFMQVSSAAVNPDAERQESGYVEHKIIFRRNKD